MDALSAPAPTPPGADQPRVGFCCIWLPDDDDPKEKRRHNMIGTTVTALARMERGAAFAKVLDLVRHNMAALRLQLDRVAAMPPVQRLMRIESGVLPIYSHPVARWMYDEPAMREVVESGLAAAGDAARSAGIRLSMHPGQFCVLGTASEQTLRNSVAEFEYHADVIRWMGLAGGWHPWGAHVNVHAGAGAVGVEGFRRGLAQLSADARGLVTVENDESTYGLDALLPLVDDLPIVVDLHHHWVHSAGEYLEADDPRLGPVRASWRGVRPVSHISVSREDLLPGHPTDQRPDFAALAATGLRARDLRAHSDLMWNDAVNAWTASHLDWTDIEVEAKQKNRASAQLAAWAERQIAAAMPG